jgi:branched-chain amino acid aminotransferase
MEIPLSKNVFFDVIRRAVRRNELQQGAIKVIGFYPHVSFDILPLEKKLDIAVFAFDPSKEGLTQDRTSGQGVTACVSKWRKLDPRTVPVEAKAAANYLNGMLARNDARARGFDYAVMLDTEGFVAEGGTESVFLIKDGCLRTPLAGAVLKGITRKSLLEIAMVLEMESSETRLGSEDLFHADEIFFAGTPAKVLPVSRIEDKVFQEVPGPFTQRLQLFMEGIISGREKHFRKWLFPVD